jgi:hypothetical protein
MTTSDSPTTEKPATATTSDDSRKASPSGSSAGAASTPSATGSNLKAGLVLVLVIVLVLVAGAGFLVKNNETVARQLLSWNVQLPAWLLPASVSQQSVDNGSNTASQSSSGDEGASSQAPSTGASIGGADSLRPGSPLDASASASGGAVQGSASVAAEPSAPIRPAPQLDPAFRKSLQDIDRLSRSLLALPAGPQKPSLPEAAMPKPSGSLLAGAAEQPDAPMLEPGVFDKSLQFLQSLVRVQTVQGPDFAARPQAFYQLINQQMQAQLAAARLALLLGEVALAGRELEQTELLLERHFDRADPKVFQLQAEFSGLRRQVESLQ